MDGPSLSNEMVDSTNDAFESAGEFGISANIITDEVSPSVASAVGDKSSTESPEIPTAKQKLQDEKIEFPLCVNGNQDEEQAVLVAEEEPSLERQTYGLTGEDILHGRDKHPAEHQHAAKVKNSYKNSNEDVPKCLGCYIFCYFFLFIGISGSIGVVLSVSPPIGFLLLFFWFGFFCWVGTLGGRKSGGNRGGGGGGGGGNFGGDGGCGGDGGGGGCGGDGG